MFDRQAYNRAYYQRHRQTLLERAAGYREARRPAPPHPDTITAEGCYRLALALFSGMEALPWLG